MTDQKLTLFLIASCLRRSRLWAAVSDVWAYAFYVSPETVSLRSFKNWRMLESISAIIPVDYSKLINLLLLISIIKAISIWNQIN